MKIKLLGMSVLLFPFVCQPLMGGCFKCEEIRERNKHLPPLKYEYYDDYLEALKTEAASIPDEIDFGEENDHHSLVQEN